MDQQELAGIPPPFALAMVVCDGVWNDPATGKKFILGTFSSLGSRSFPAVHPMLSLYITLTNGRGKVPFRVQIVDVDEERPPINEARGEIEFPDPRSIVELVLMMMGVNFPSAGEYRIQLFVSDEFVMERRLLLVHIPEVKNG